MDNFRSIDEIQPPYRNIFTEYPCFNAVQSQVLDDVLYTDKSVVVSAPTGSGKTAIFELAITRLLIQYENFDISQKIKMVYISPIKALCHERLSDWHNKFSPFGINCVSATGDSDYMDIQQLTHHNLIISTPEKWDSLTRRWRDYEKIVKVIKLFMIDEVHLLNEENRGSTLEVIVSRMKTVENSRIPSADDENDIFNEKVRFIALSATVPNVDDIAEWIGKSPNTKYYRFSEEMRPVKLKKIVYGYSYNPKVTSPFKFDISLNYKLSSLIMQYSEGKPTLIFCSTRKSVEMTANHIVQSLKITFSEEQTQKLLDVANMITDAKAKGTIKHGVAYHHAGMIPETRHAIESLFRNGDLPVLVTTSTLAMGVNLPAHLVIIKSTKCYDNGGFRDYTETAIHQMIGRAGRPQFDTTATALILTTNEDKRKFERMMGCSQPIESNLHRHLTEHLNAEIVLGTITDLDVAMQWLSSTFLYIRARKNPHHYGINVGFTKDQIDRKLLEICQIDLNKLVKTKMISMDENIIITPNAIGKIMAKYYVAFETMKLFTQISGSEILMQILALISKCQEFEPMRLRVNDKKTLNLLNKNTKKDTIRFPLNGKIKTWDMKVNCIIQAVLGNLDILDHSILSDSLTIMRNGERIAKCLTEYLQTRGKYGYNALLNAIILAKCFHVKLWENSPYISKQLTGIGSVMSTQLANAGKTTFKKILGSNPRDLELIIKRKPPMGDTLISQAKHVPSYNMTLEKLTGGKQLELCIILENGGDIREKSTVNLRSTMTLLVGNGLNEILVYEKYQHAYMTENSVVQKLIDVDRSMEGVNAHFISEDWVGIDCNCALELQSKDSNKTNKTPSITKSPDKEGPTYIQTFLDMYMKTKKKATEAPAKKGNTIMKKEKTDVKASRCPNSGAQKVEEAPKQKEKCEVSDEAGSSKAEFKDTAISDISQEELEEIFNISDMSLFSTEEVECENLKAANTNRDEKVDVTKNENIMKMEVMEEATEGSGRGIQRVEEHSVIFDKKKGHKHSSFEERVIRGPSLFDVTKRYGTEVQTPSGSVDRPQTKDNNFKKMESIEKGTGNSRSEVQWAEPHSEIVNKKNENKPSSFEERVIRAPSLSDISKRYGAEVQTPSRSVDRPQTKYNDLKTLEGIEKGTENRRSEIEWAEQHIEVVDKKKEDKPGSFEERLNKALSVFHTTKKNRVEVQIPSIGVHRTKIKRNNNKEIEVIENKTENSGGEVQPTEKHGEIVDKKKENKPRTFEERVIKTPFRIGKKCAGEVETPSRNLNRSQSKRKGDDIERAMEFEDSLYKENTQKKQKLQEFKFPTKKKFSFDSTTKILPDSTVENQYYVKEILEPCERQKNIFHSSEGKNREIAQKSITWSSPLVVSPLVKFSPRICYQDTYDRAESEERHTSNEINNETFETTTSSKTNLTINIQKSPYPHESSRNSKRSRATPFLLRDKDYNDTNNEQGNDTLDTFDICSSSFLDKVGLPKNPHKPASKIDKPSPTLDYYSQYLTTPIKSEKQKTSGTTSEPDKNNKNNDLENNENFRGNSTCTKTDKICSQRATESDKQDSLFQKMYTSPQQLLTERDNSQRQVQDITNSYTDDPHVPNHLTQDRAILYSNNQHLSQLEPNRNYWPHNFPPHSNNMHYCNEKFPDPYVQPNYQCIQYPTNYCPQDFQRCCNFNQNPSGMNQTFNRSNVPLRSWSHDPAIYNHNPNIPRSTQFNGDSSRMYPNVSFYADFETRGCNQSQGVEDIPNYEEYHQPRQHSQYFQRNTTSNPYQPIMTESISQARPAAYPEMLSLHELSQQIEPPCTQTNKKRAFVQRKSFEEKMNEENTLRNMENSYFGPVSTRDALEASTSSQNFVRNYDDRNDPCFLPYPGKLQKSGFYPREARNPQRNFDRGVNENLKNFNRSLSFEERSDFGAARHSRAPEYIQGPQREDMNPSFCGRSCCLNLQEQNYQNNFGNTSSLNRSFVPPARSHFPEQNFGSYSSSQDMFPPNDDKKYVMNKFLYSLSQH